MAEYYTYYPKGVCSQRIDIELEGDTIKDVKFTGGCNGNLKAIAKLIQGQSAEQIISLLEGNTCGPRPTSCADQLARALKAAKEA